MESFVYKTIIIALIAAFIVLLAKKWGLIEYIQIHGNDFFNKMAHCDFCLSFWAGCMVATLFVFITGELTFMLVPFCSTSITRMLV